ncbi:MAG: hypothetical protein ACFE0J_16310 [Elainellaceae cyanobacterium]
MAIASFNVSELIRYIPYSIIGGFLAGIGVLFVQGAFKLLLNTSITFSTLGVFIQLDEVLKWLPSLGFAILLLGLLQRI